MSEPVKISLADCKRVSQLLDNDWGDNPVAAVAAVLTAYNRFLNADPIGTVRHSPDGREMAISTGNHHWWLHDLSKTPQSPRHISHDPVIPSWRVVYNPENAVGVTGEAEK